MNNRASYIALGVMIAILIAVDVFLLLQTVSYRKEIAIKDEVISDLSRNQVLTSYLESNLAFGLKFNRLKLSDSSIVDLNGSEISIRKLIERPVIVFRFSEHDCRECVSFGFMKFSAFAENTACRALVMVRYNDIHPFQRWGRTIEYSNVGLYFAPSNIAPDELSVPYFFMLYEDGTIGDVFIPDKSNPKYTNEYLELILEKYYKPR